MWFRKSKYQSLDEVNAASVAEHGDPTFDPSWDRRVEEFDRDVKIYNWPLIFGLIVGVLVVLVLFYP